MKIYFSKTTMGFYFDVIHENIPDDVVEITSEEYQNLLEKQSAGFEIIADKNNGFPKIAEQ